MARLSFALQRPTLDAGHTTLSTSPRPRHTTPHPTRVACLRPIPPSRRAAHFSRWEQPRIGSGSNASVLCMAETGKVSSAEPDENKGELSERLAKAEAEAEALRKELEIRKSLNNVDLSSLTPTSSKRIDGTGFRETIFEGPGGKGEKKKGKEKWGLSEAEIFFSKGAPGEIPGSSSSGLLPAMEEGAEDTIRRRLVIGLSLSAVTIALSFVKLPTLLTKPSKPLFFYIVPLLELQEGLKKILTNDSIDTTSLNFQLKRITGQPDSVKANLLSAAALLESPQGEAASNLAFEIIEYLDQADYQKYFESRAQPSESQKIEFLKFSLQSIQAVDSKLAQFLKLIPREDMEAASLQLSRQLLT